ncbi:hypothetical protein ANN_14345 [Periplaneta americana]|uniref:Reverse transcriptase domain-containing protein n=1 Tax=Periplaneta americana TaxID=6978 RepID=A0ABQ8SW21_PERAM|nr:hypothetical protein ANN_14345 [Periplaneta americana]
MSRSRSLIRAFSLTLVPFEQSFKRTVVSRAMHDGTSKVSGYNGQHLWSLQVQEIQPECIPELINSFLVAFREGLPPVRKILHAANRIVEIEEKDKEKTSFCSPYGSFEYNRMAFGLVGALSTFQRLMDSVLSGLKGISCYVYLDGILTVGSTIEEHAQRLEEIFKRLWESNLKANPLKCSFAVSEIEYLGHIVSRNGVSPDPMKVEAIKNYPRPKTPRHIRSFLGLAGYYRRHICNFAEIAKPLTNLRKKKNVKFEWTDEQQQAFDTLRDASCGEPILKFYDFKYHFILATDASGVAVGAVLSQKIGDVEHPIAYASRVLNQAERNYSVTERELLALVWATKYFRCYLHGHEFVAVTEHSALRWLLSLKDPSSRLLRWSLRLAEFKFTVQYKPGKKYQSTDALSRAYLISSISQDPDSDSVRSHQLTEPEYYKWLADPETFRLD